MRPVSDEFAVSQEFGSFATAGVLGDPNGTEVQQLVAAYGNYQPYGHAGQDIGCPVGTPVHAIAPGTVLWADWGTNLPGDDSWSASGYFARWALYKTFPGIVTVIQHEGWISVYAHLSDAPLNPGDVVTEGQQIALSGNTRSPGVTLGAHLHVEALVDLTYSTANGLIYGRMDPTPYFGTISPQGTITPEGFLMALTDTEQQTLLEGVAYLRSAQFKQDIFTGSTDGEVQARQAFHKESWNTPVPNVLTGGATTPAIEVSWASKNVATLGAMIAAAASKGSAAQGPVPVDVQALAAQLAPLLNANQAEQFMTALRTQINK